MSAPSWLQIYNVNDSLKEHEEMEYFVTRIQANISKHILQECKVFAHLRQVIFSQAFLVDMVSILSQFIIHSNFKWFLVG